VNRAAAGAIDLTWLGQAGFQLAGKGDAVLIDLFLSPHELRLHPPPPLESLDDNVAWLLATHEHLDHLDLPSLPALLARFPELHLVLPGPLVPRVASLLPADRVHGVQPGDVITGRGLSIRPVPACHGLTVADGYGNGRARPSDPTPFLGYLIDFRGLTIYHAGDTILNEEVLESLQRERVDVALLPVNGRDASHEAAGIVGNLNVREAVEFAARIGAQILIPMHHDLVRGNTERAGAASDVAFELGVHLHVMTPARYVPLRLAAFRERV
jgi:L-ascorbate metabolism protein UlaG (beta-lactamase superfamily)